MSSGLVIQKHTVSTVRNNRPVNIAQSIIPVGKNRTDSKIYAMIFHKSFYGYILIALNSNYKCMQAWSDVVGILPIKAKKITNLANFRTLIMKSKPIELYLNDGELLKPINFIEPTNVKVYCNKTFITLLDELQRVYQENVSNSIANKKENKNLLNTHLNIPTFEDMLIMDPTITAKEYRIFYNQLVKKRN